MAEAKVKMEKTPGMETYMELRSQLEAMEYREYLGVDSMPLVERLLADLILTTESHQTQQEKLDKVQNKLDQIEEDAFPLRRENARLVRENNQLHLEMIKRAEEFDSKERQWKIELKKLEEKARDVAFFNQSRNQDKENDTKEGNKNDLNEKLKKLEHELENARSQIASRDSEIGRLGEQLEKHGVIGSAKKKNARENKNTISQLMDQIDFLNAQLADQEEKLKTARIDSRLLGEARRELKRLKGDRSERKPSETNTNNRLGDLIEAYNSDKQRFNGTIHQLEAELAETHEEVANLKRELETSQSNAAKWESEGQRLEKERARLSAALDASQRALTRLQGGRVSATEETQVLRGQLDNLESLVQEHVSENASLRSELEQARLEVRRLEKLQTERESGENVNHVEFIRLQDEVRRLTNVVDTLKIERDGLQQEVAKYVSEQGKIIAELQSNKLELEETRSRSERDSSRVRVLEDEVNVLTQRLSEKHNEFQREAGARAELERLTNLPQVVRELEEQLARWRERAASLDSESRRMGRELKQEKIRAEELTKEQRRLDKMLNDARAEREALVAKERNLGQQLEDSKLKIKSLEDERDHLSKLQNEHATMLSETGAQRTQHEIELDRLRLQVQKSDAKAQASARRESLLEEQLATLRKDNVQYEKQVIKLKQDYETTSSEVERLRNTVLIEKQREITLREEELKQVTHELKDAESRVRSTLERLDEECNRSSQLQAHLDKFKALISKMDATREGLQQRAKALHTAVTKEREINQELKNGLETSKQATRLAKEKIEHLQRTVSDLKEQKHNLHLKLEQRANAVATLEEAVTTQERKYRELEEKLAASKRMLHNHTQALEARDEDVQKLNTELENAKSEIQQLKATCQMRNGEVSAASQDLANMTRENQAVNAVCQTLRVERDRLRAQLGEATARASRLDGLLESAKLEKSDLLGVYRRACDENKRLKLLVQELSTSRARAVGEQQAQSLDASRLTKRLAESEELCRRQRVDLEAFERQVSDLSRQLQMAHSKIETYEEDRVEVEKTANIARETSNVMLQREQGLRWELAQAQAEIRKLGTRTSQLQTENEVLNSQLLREKRRYQDLELVVSRTRAENAQAQLVQRSQSEQVEKLKSELHTAASADSLVGNNRSQPLGEEPGSSASRADDVGKTGFTGASSSVSSSSSNGTSTNGMEKQVAELEDMIQRQNSVIRDMRRERIHMTNVTDSMEQSLDNLANVTRLHDRDQPQTPSQTEEATSASLDFRTS